MNQHIKALPFIDSNQCLNTHTAEHTTWHCQTCVQMCPAQAIELSNNHLPRINDDVCTGCLGCLSSCPNEALGYDDIALVQLVQQASDLAQQSKKILRVTCENYSDDDADMQVSCHAIWSPLLLASLAGEGIQTLHLQGIESCQACPKQFGKSVLEQVKSDYTTLNQALGIQLNISTQVIQQEKVTTKTTATLIEPERRAFFRNLIPTLASNSIKDLSQLSQSEHQGFVYSAIDDDVSNRPVALKLFLNALPHLQCNFTPIPWLPSLLLGSIQIDDTCTACGDCITTCPNQALSIREFGRQHILEFSASSCTGCDLCTHICSENAIQLLPSISLPSLLKDKPRPLVMVTKKIP